MSKKSSLSVLLNGIIKENPVLVLILGTCPTLATTTTVSGAFAVLRSKALTRAASLTDSVLKSAGDLEITAADKAIRV